MDIQQIIANIIISIKIKIKIKTAIIIKFKIKGKFSVITIRITIIQEISMKKKIIHTQQVIQKMKMNHIFISPEVLLFQNPIIITQTK